MRSRLCTYPTCPRGGGASSGLTPLPWKRTTGERHHFLELTLLLTSEAQLWGETQLLSVVRAEASGEQGEKKKLCSETHQPLQFIPVCKRSSGLCAREKRRPFCLNTACVCNFCASVQSAVSGYQPAVFGKILPCIFFGDFFSRSSYRWSVKKT